MTVLQLPSATTAVTREGTENARRPRIRWTEARALFAVVLVVELALALVLTVGFESLMGDSLARVANAKAVLDSRDPKLAALGFVWSPLPSLLLLPLVPLGRVSPFLLDSGLVIALQSAVAAAGCAVALRGLLADLGVRQGPRLGLVAAFALHPYVLLYGANGMTEPLLVLWLLLATRALARWLRRDRSLDLAVAGLFLALAYLTRYEAVGAVAGATFAVLVTTALRGKGGWRRRLDSVVCDLLVVAGPATVAAVVFALTSLVVVGHPFEQLSSQYGNSAQQALYGSSGPDHDVLGRVLDQQAVLQPLCWALVAAAALAALLRRDARLVAGLAVVGGTLGLSVLLAMGGHTFGWLRFQFYVVPLGVLAAGHLVATSRHARVTAGVSGGPARFLGGLTWTLTAVTLAAVAAPAWVTIPPALSDERLAPEDVPQAGAVLDRLRGRQPARSVLGWARTDREVAAWLDQRELPDGAVLVDLASGFEIVLASERPRRFVITSDGDFPKLLADPHLAPVRYLLVSQQTGYDAVTVAHPSLYADGAGLARLVREFRNPVVEGRDWRLYQVLPRQRTR
jgi:hypothetical protein